ncbi:hypothetical protein HFP51_11400 [Parasphingopyxis sp. CP4]|uniref:hypothetical protein n=1 Tax=Parasphingopyxis sp. CP4 TaxID=2724527 RepID=UPI0015A0B87A|nr:hypothetical protein [Parasphingopyxis sp. CP4]QLC22730.1 hypothetical protein HFP51_11400 [Parasphingopyxis sp. CP4]
MADDDILLDSLQRPIDPAAPTVCLLGNSHSQAYRHALASNSAPFDGVTLDFFSGNLAALQTLSVQGDAFVTDHDGLCKRWSRNPPHKAKIRPADYDAFVLVGLGVDYMLALRALAKLDLFSHSAGQRLISRAAFRAIIAENFKLSFAYFMVRNLREMTDAPIALIVTPRPGETLIERPAYSRYTQDDGMAVIGEAGSMTEEVAYEIFGGDVRLVLPDPALSASSGLTRRDMMRSGGEEWDGLEPHDDGYDHVHMNAGYARHMLDCFAPVFAELLASR